MLAICPSSTGGTFMVHPRLSSLSTILTSGPKRMFVRNHPNTPAKADNITFFHMYAFWGSPARNLFELDFISFGLVVGNVTICGKHFHDRSCSFFFCARNMVRGVTICDRGLFPILWEITFSVFYVQYSFWPSILHWRTPSGSLITDAYPGASIGWAYIYSTKH